MRESIQISPEAEAALLQIMKENDSQIIPSGIFEAVTTKYPVEANNA